MVKKLKELSNLDLDKALVKVPGYGGTFSKDKLPQELEGKFFVVNMQDLNDGPGTHWILIDDRDPSYVNFFDSEGAQPPKSVQKLMKKTKKKMKTNHFMIQPLESSACGWYCIAAAKAMTSNENGMENFISHFDLNETGPNDKILQKLL